MIPRGVDHSTGDGGSVWRFEIETFVFPTTANHAADDGVCWLLMLKLMLAVGCNRIP